MIARQYLPHQDTKHHNHDTKLHQDVPADNFDNSAKVPRLDKFKNTKVDKDMASGSF